MRITTLVVQGHRNKTSVSGLEARLTDSCSSLVTLNSIESVGNLERHFA